MPSRALGAALTSALLLFAVHDARALDAGEASAAPEAARSEGLTRTFPYRQRRYLFSRDGRGGLAYVTSGARHGEVLPVVVFLHGMNPDGHVHPWLGATHRDLRGVVEPLVKAGRVAPFVLAAPTHTRYATGATVMWPGFDLGDFLDATQAALGDVATLDRARVVLVGHSAAGCNPRGGLFTDRLGKTDPVAIVAVDTCLDDDLVERFSALASRTRVHALWQRGWSRPFHELQSRCPTCSVRELTVPGGAPHEDILPMALDDVLPTLLPPLVARP